MDASYLERLGDLAAVPPLKGFLTGVVDLVFRAKVGGQPRWFIADYKSNRLGERRPGPSTVSHYGLAALRREMTLHHYYLQYHLYAVALHRYLRWRLGDGYDWDRDVGGVYYLFLRGMIGPETPRDDANHVAGVFFDTPRRELVDALSMLLSDPKGGSP
jgi:exodeoxyribonuclease V beta subunit